MEKMTIYFAVNVFMQDTPNEIAHMAVNDNEVAVNGRTISQVVDTFKSQGWIIERAVMYPSGTTNSVTYYLSRG